MLSFLKNTYLFFKALLSLALGTLEFISSLLEEAGEVLHEVNEELEVYNKKNKKIERERAVKELESIKENMKNKHKQ